jgi:hypothetical protein
VQAGDLLGLETTSSTVLHTLATTAADSRAQYNAPFAAVGGNQAAAGPFSGYRVSVSVPFVAAGVTTCVLSAVRRAGSPGFAGGFDQGDVTVTASAGLQSISNVQVTNGAVTAPTFTPGTTAPVIVTTTKSTQGLITRFSFDATDAGAVTKHCA